MLGALLLTSYSSCNQMLSANQLTENHNDPLNLIFVQIFVSCRADSFGVLTSTFHIFWRLLVKSFQVCFDFITLSFETGWKLTEEIFLIS